MQKEHVLSESNQETVNPPVKLKVICFVSLLPVLLIGGLIWFIHAAHVSGLVRFQLSFCACILSFLGATHWGIILRSMEEDGRKVTWGRILWSLTPVVLALVTFYTEPFDSAGLLILGIVATYYADRILCDRGELPYAYLKLRMCHTAGLFIGLFSTFIFFF